MKNKLFFFLIMSVLVLGITGCNNKDLEVEKKEKNENTKNSYVIVDEIEENQLSCASAVEQFYEDANYAYSWSCIKDSNIKVKYEDGSTKLVSEALKDGSIKISDLDENNIKYLKQAK